MNVHPLQGLHWSARFSSLQRQGLALLPTALTVWLAAGPLQAWPSTVVLTSWVVYCASYLALVGHLAWRLDAADTRRRAAWEDPGAAMLFMLVTLAACASLVAVALAVDAGALLQGLSRLLHLVLMMLSVAGAWLLIQGVFALHYARRYYQDDPNGGLVFPGGLSPDYLDFFYFSAVVGMTSQVSDVSVTGRGMRRLVLWHGMLSFAFNLTVLALAVNVLAGGLR